MKSSFYYTKRGQPSKDWDKMEAIDEINPERLEPALAELKRGGRLDVAARIAQCKGEQLRRIAQAKGIEVKSRYSVEKQKVLEDDAE